MCLFMPVYFPVIQAHMSSYACLFPCHLGPYILSCLPIFLLFRPIYPVMPASFLLFAPICPVMPAFFLLFAPLCPVMPTFSLLFRPTYLAIPASYLPFYFICSPISVCFWPFTCVTPLPLFLYAFLRCRCKVGFRGWGSWY
jgi:hypothetical protein